MKNWIQKYGFWILVSGVAIFWIYRQWPHSIAIQDIQTEQRDGQIVPLTIAEDSITIVHFYAHWCGPCMRELPEIAQVSKAYQSAGVSIICITDDDFSFIDDIKSRTALNIKRTPSLKDLKVFSIPMTYIYNHKGEQVQRIEGPFEWSDPNTLKEILKNE
jgi:thiol-disulfide isomerase/thioredoxin